MASEHLRIDAPGKEKSAPRGRTILLTSPMSGAAAGKNLGSSAYSYDFLVRSYLPLLQRWGTVVQVQHPETQLDAAILAARQRNTTPVHVSILPFQDVCLSKHAPNVVVPAWEFPDVPNYAVNGNPRNNWVDVANRCDLILAAGPFIAAALKKGGVRSPIRIVQTPTPPEYYRTTPWRAGATATIACANLVLPSWPVLSASAPAARNDDLKNPQSANSNRGIVEVLRAGRAGLQSTLRAHARNAFKQLLRPCLPFVLDQALTAAIHSAARSRSSRLVCRPEPCLSLSGVVYTSIFNPDDPRKNWEDLLTGFLYALRDCEDATLVLKLVARSRNAANQVLAHYRQLGMAHRCQLVLITDYLTESQMVELAAASTYYITTTRAEGMCLPLMNFLAAGRPAISPVHTAIGDYFHSDAGFAVESHPEPAAWPLDPEHHFRTTWARLVWPSLVEQIRASYYLAKGDSTGYAAMSARARETIKSWCDQQTIWPRMEAALNLVDPCDRLNPTSIMQSMESLTD